MARTQIPGAQIADKSVTDADVSDTAAIGNHKIAYPAGTKSADYTIQNTDYVIFASAAAGPVVVTLPSAIGINGKQYIIKKVDSTANAVVISTTGGQTIDGQSSLSVITPMVSVTVVSDNSTWWVI